MTNLKSKRTRLGRTLNPILAACALGVLPIAISCGGVSRAPKQRVKKAVLVVQCSESQAELWLNGSFWREVKESSFDAKIPVGEHRIEVRHPEFHSMYYEITLRDRERKVLNVSLAPRLR